MQTSFDKLSDIPAMVDAWADALLSGRIEQAHQLRLRLTTLPRFRQEGLDALVARCTAPGAADALTEGLLRQLCCSAANGRGGRHARKYAVAVGLSMRWLERGALDELNWAVYGYWLEALKSRRLTVGAMGQTSAIDLLTQARFLVDHQMAPVVPGLAPRYAEWLEERCVTGYPDDTLCWMLDGAHTQTLWVTTQTSDSIRQSVLNAQADPRFLESTAHQVQGAWHEAVDRFLSLWVTDDPEKVRTPLYSRRRTPWISVEMGRTVRAELLAAMQVSAPLEPHAAWQRQQTQNFLHGLVDCVFYTTRTSGVLGLFPVGGRLFGLTWSTTPQPRMNEYSRELSPPEGRGAMPEAPPPLSRDTLDALWHAAQHYWDHEGEPPAGAEGAPDGAMLMAERSHGWLPLPWTERSREWALDWARELPHTVRVWCPPGADAAAAGLRVPRPPVQLLQAPAGETQQRAAVEVEVAEDAPAGSACLEEVIFGAKGRELVTEAWLWERGFARHAQQPLARAPLAHESGLAVSVEQGLPKWLDDALTPRGRTLLGGWLRQHSPAALCEPFDYARRLAGLPEEDALALAQWLRSSPLYETRNAGFAWSMAALLNVEHVRRVQVDRDAFAHQQALLAPRESLFVHDALRLGPWVALEYGEDAQPVSPHSEVEPPRRSFFRGIQLWSQAQTDETVQLVIAVHERTIVEVRDGDRAANSFLLGDGRRQRWVDWHAQEQLPRVTPNTRLVDLWNETDKKAGKAGHVSARSKAALEHLAQLGRLCGQGLLSRTSADLMLSPPPSAPTLQEAFRRTASSEPSNVFGGVVLQGWRLQPGTGLPLVQEISETPRLAPQEQVPEPVPEPGPGRTTQISRSAPPAAKSRHEALRLSFQERLHLGQLLRQARQTLGMTAQAVAHDVFALSAAHASVGRIERGCLESVPLDRLLMLLAFYGLEYGKVLAQSRAGAVVWATQARHTGARLRSVREALGLTPAAFAAWVQAPPLTEADVQRIETGKAPPRVDVVDQVLRRQPSLSRNWLLAQETQPQAA